MCLLVSEMKYSYNQKKKKKICPSQFACVLFTSRTEPVEGDLLYLYSPSISNNTCPHNQEINDENIRCYVVLVIKSLCCVCCSCLFKRVNCLMKWIPTDGNSLSVALCYSIHVKSQLISENQNSINIYVVLVYADHVNLLEYHFLVNFATLSQVT
jgi:hypothetical protein